MRCLVILLTLVVPLFQGGATPVVGPPSIPYETVLRVLTLRPASPLLPLAPEIWTLSEEASVDVAFALAIWLKESEFGTTGVSVSTQNPGNLTCAAADPTRRSGCTGRWATYANWSDAVADWFTYIQRRYVAQGLTTVEAILPVYAPASENDTAVYIAQVTTWLRDWGSGTVGSASPGTGITIREQIMDDWVQRPI
ncbi:MAG: glucosaminidase domain-containing protein, partial [Chloroflexota bacterium]|nr:glucosaminidase domain-containing protein [Chloroflexota bacterium]